MGAILNLHNKETLRDLPMFLLATRSECFGECRQEFQVDTCYLSTNFCPSFPPTKKISNF